MNNYPSGKGESYFKEIDIYSMDFQKNVIKIMVSIFKKKKLKQVNEKKKLVQEVLCSIFKLFSFDFESFMTHLKLTEEEKIDYLSFLLYEIYYNEVLFDKIIHFSGKESIEFMSLSLLVERLPSQKNKPLFDEKSDIQKLKLAVFCMQNMREGAFALLDMLSKEYGDNHPFTQAIKLVRRGYYNVSLLSTLLVDSEDFHSVIEKIENLALDEVRQVMEMLPVVKDLIITLPTRGIQFFKERVFTQNVSSDDLQEANKHLNRALEAEKEFKKLFDPYPIEDYSLQEMCQFFKVFGLSSHYLEDKEFNTPYARLVEGLNKAIEMMKTCMFLETPLAHSIVQYILSIYRQLFTFYKNSSVYGEGLKTIVYTLVTRGQGLKEQPFIPSILAGFSEIAKEVHSKTGVFVNLTEVPLIIFDQSDNNQFNENHFYIKELQEKNKSPLWHISNRQALSLARKLGLIHWIQTGPNKKIGFGGSRNCQLFLAPVVAELSQRGVQSMKEILKNKKEVLLSIYKRRCLGDNKENAFIHIGEDDVFVPITHLFSEALFANLHKDFYSFKPSFCIGRATHRVYPLLDGKNIKDNPARAFYTAKWFYEPMNGGMKGCVTKPKFCLPFYFGNEELHSNPTRLILDFFSNPVIHLGHARYPKYKLPLSPFEGIYSILKTSLPYMIQISLSSSLIDSKNDCGRCILPWKDSEGQMLDVFKNLEEVWQFKSSPEVIKELKKRFWKNVEDLFLNPLETNLEVRQNIEMLANFDNHIKLPASLKTLYKKLQIDALMFFSFGNSLLRYREEGKKDYLEEAKRDVEKEFNIKTSKTHIVKDFVNLIHFIDSFEKYCLF